LIFLVLHLFLFFFHLLLLFFVILFIFCTINLYLSKLLIVL